jgi:phosphoribosylformylglycinamidine synthase
MGNVRRIYVEKKSGFDVEAREVLHDLRVNLGIKTLEGIRIIHRYDVEGIDTEVYEKAIKTVFSEPPVDLYYNEEYPGKENALKIAIEYLPGQYDQRADSAAQCIQILSKAEKPICKTARIVEISGNITKDEYNKIKEYLINPVESREAGMEKPDTLKMKITRPNDVKIIDRFIDMKEDELIKMLSEYGFAMSKDDIMFCRNYFKNEEKRNPTITEMRMIDTYWSDHCRHTTFLTEIENVEIEKSATGKYIKEAYDMYSDIRKELYKGKNKPECLMDIALMGMKEIKRRGKLEDLDISDEINACSINVKVDVNGKKEDWLVMFKNETHNHPTEIEPFGGAATCLGGAIRDPLSGRVYVYQAMRVTGSGNPLTPVKDTLPGKLPQSKITTTAAHGYSSYGNQIGLATGIVKEIYDEGFVAKRMEIGAVIGAAPKKNVKREKPQKGDIIILLGGRTGRDGCGGATGSSKEHTEESLMTCGSEVQKGNPPTERKIQRLFRNPEVRSMIKKCNDFGAGGVSVAIGELADGLDIDLDAVPRKYEGLDGTELAISESQERMAVIIDKDDEEKFINESQKENLEAVRVATVTDTNRLIMIWRGKEIVNLTRDFINSNGAPQKTSIKAGNTDDKDNWFKNTDFKGDTLEDKWENMITDLNIAGQRGLVEMFDSTIGAASVTMPYGGEYQLSPMQTMVAKIPVLSGETETCSLMSYGYNPKIGKWSPFHGALYAVLESISKLVATGAKLSDIRLTLQEYFEKLGTDPYKWGKPFSALLGALYIQLKLDIPAIGGKDSMSGTFKDLNVPPTLVSFAVATGNTGSIASTDFKYAGSNVYMLKIKYDENSIPDFDSINKVFGSLSDMFKDKKVLASYATGYGGIAEAVSKMSFGNKIGLEIQDTVSEEMLFKPLYGSIIIETNENPAKYFDEQEFGFIGKTTDEKIIKYKDNELNLDKLINKWNSVLEPVYPTATEEEMDLFIPDNEANKDTGKKEPVYSKPLINLKTKIAMPRVFIPVFPGTNCEYDTEKRFIRAGAIVESYVIKNQNASDIENTLADMEKIIRNSQIIMLPGGFSAGDEPEGSGKFIAAVFRNPGLKDAITDLLENRDGLMLGICNGFQALIKLGLLPYGKIIDLDDKMPTLTYNSIGRHVSKMVYTKVVSHKSPWLQNAEPGIRYTIPVSHGEGRFIATEDELNSLIKNDQIATQYVNVDGTPATHTDFNPNGSMFAIEGITSPDGRILGKMGHSERIGNNVAINVPGEKDQKIFEAGIAYFD